MHVHEKGARVRAVVNVDDRYLERNGSTGRRKLDGVAGSDMLPGRERFVYGNIVAVREKTDERILEETGGRVVEESRTAGRTCRARRPAEASSRSG